MIFIFNEVEYNKQGIQLKPRKKDLCKESRRYLLLVDKDSSHAHSRADAHAGHEDLRASILSNGVTSGDLPCTSYKSQQSAFSSTLE